MRNKLAFLTKVSLKKKIKTKWFVIANILFLILIVGGINIDSIIKTFGGDFDEPIEIYVIDNANVYNKFEHNYNLLNTQDKNKIIKYTDDYNKGLEKVKQDKKILLEINSNEDNCISAKLISNDGINITTETLINNALRNTKSELLLHVYNISPEMYEKINSNIEIEKITLKEDAESNMMVSSIMQFITFPVFMLIIFLVQMIGAEVNEEKSTKSMEIIISNVSPKTHFLSKILSANIFVIIQGALLIIFLIIGVLLRYFLCGGNIIGDYGVEVNSVISAIPLLKIKNTIGYMLPILLVMLLLTFIAYSLLAGILASMTTNLEDFQQLQTPIVIISLIGFYLSMMTGVFKGSTFIKVMSYIPFISSMLAPSLYLMGEITIFDLFGSILLLLLTIFLLAKYGIRIYKVGILNYSQTGLWSKMFKAMKKEVKE